MVETIADRVRRGIDETLHVDTIRTGDLGGKATTREFAQALARRVS